ncbi:methylthioribulose 1-phosphate dehydratase [Paenibacillus segetis]|uniref:Methylthioribulose-1-phosphate dehydratase n=1 Tax=Paenibacillus segetis TaxID=1325360 RepID=A0ABQ1YF97_9BACL|nr:methylthioribulose 1-phosphate dehydratase [Paenibacillus segetis]GGH24076.1 methylthioribulose-1-phosphate dehydratase [Paenibacillus segetis]
MDYADITLEEKQTVLEELRTIKEQFAARDWFPGSSGNLSVRVGDFSPDSFHFAVTASGKNESVHTPDNFLFVDSSCEPCETTKLKPSIEALIHAKIYRMTGCSAIFHVHTVFNNLLSERFGESGFLQVQGIELIKELGIWEENTSIRIPILPNHADILSIAKLIPSALNPDIPGILLRNHGIFAWGKNALEAKHHLEVFEFIFELEYRRLTLG